MAGSKGSGEDAAAATTAKVEVVASHAALGVVAGWLGISVEEALNEAGPSSERQDEQGRRAPGLGLGAKYTPHHKQVGFAAALDNKLKRRLERGGAQLPVRIGANGKLFSGQRNGAQAEDQAGDSSSDDDEEDLGKARSITTGPRAKANGNSGAREAGAGTQAAAQGGAGNGTEGGNGAKGQGAGQGGKVLTAKERQQLLMFGAAPEQEQQAGGKRKKKKRKSGGAGPAGTL